MKSVIKKINTYEFGYYTFFACLGFLISHFVFYPLRLLGMPEKGLATAFLTMIVGLPLLGLFLFALSKGKLGRLAYGIYLLMGIVILMYPCYRIPMKLWLGALLMAGAWGYWKTFLFKAKTKTYEVEHFEPGERYVFETDLLCRFLEVEDYANAWARACQGQPVTVRDEMNGYIEADDHTCYGISPKWCRKA
jgi:hypothetical protein